MNDNGEMVECPICNMMTGQLHMFKFKLDRPQICEGCVRTATNNNKMPISEDQ